MNLKMNVSFTLGVFGLVLEVLNTARVMLGLGAGARARLARARAPGLIVSVWVVMT